MKKILNWLQTSFIPVAVFCILLGLSLVIWPSVVTKIISYSLGGLLTVYGLIQIILDFLGKTEPRFRAYGFNIINGLISAGVGLFFIFKAGLVEQSIGFVVGMVLAVDAFMKLFRAIQLRKAAYDMWWISGVMALVSAGLAIAVFVQPSVGNGIAIFMGICLMLTGLTNFWVIYVYNKYIVKKAAAAAQGELVVKDTEHRA